MRECIVYMWAETTVLVMKRLFFIMLNKYTTQHRLASCSFGLISLWMQPKCSTSTRHALKFTDFKVAPLLSFFASMGELGRPKVGARPSSTLVVGELAVQQSKHTPQQNFWRLLCRRCQWCRIIVHIIDPC